MQITELFSDKDIEQMQKRIRRGCFALAIVAAAGLVACLVLMFQTNTLNAPYTELAAVLVSTVAGWVILYRAIYVLTPLRREISHAQMLHEELRDALQGEVVVTDERIHIRRGIIARRLEVKAADGVTKILVCESRLKALDGVGRATLYTCHGYLASFARD